MKAYKGFDKNLQCRGYQYEIGKEYETDKADLCNRGFHACEFPLDVLSYYNPEDSRYCEVDLEANDQTENDSKRCGKKIKIGAEIGLKGIVDASIKLIVEHTKKSTTKICRAHAATQGGGAHAATQGGGAHAATQGDRAHAATQGGGAHAATQGGGARASVKGKNSIACALGINGAAKGAKGCWIAVAEYDGNLNVIGGQFAMVDGEKIKEDTYYTIKNGEFVEVQDD